MISPDDVQKINLVTFNGNLTYNSNGYAMLPSYTISTILASVQDLARSELKFLPEGTHYADYINILTDYPVKADFESNLGNYYIWKGYVYKIISSQNYQNFSNYSTNHVNTLVAKDNRLKFNGTNLSLPYPQIDDTFAPLFELIALASSCFSSPNLSVLWAFQQELQPPFPYCVVNIENIKNLENTNYTAINGITSTAYQSKSSVLTVNYKFLCYDKIEAQNYLETFKINFENYSFSSDKIAFLGFEEDNSLNQEFYETKSIFFGEIKMNFSLIIEQTESSTMTINSVAASLNFST
jgi:hypothetical protein